MGEDESSDETQRWHLKLSYTEQVKIHLARALIMNPEVMVLQRPLHHFDSDKQQEILDVIKDHRDNRGVGMDPSTRGQRRPRTVFYTSESEELAKRADEMWTLEPVDRNNSDSNKQRKIVVKVLQRLPPWSGLDVHSVTGTNEDDDDRGSRWSNRCCSPSPRRGRNPHAAYA